MIRATVLRALVLTAALAAALTPVTCLGENSKRLPAKATRSCCRPRQQRSCRPNCSRCSDKRRCRNIHRSWCACSRKRRSSKSGNRTPKAVSRSSRPIRSAGGRAILGRSCRRATVRLQRDSIPLRPKLMNPNSNFHLAMNMGYPNSFDKANNRDGSLLMIHGDCWSSRLLCHDRRTDQRDLFAGARTHSSAAGRHSRSRPIRSA